jgi:Fe-S-cluster containining protein
MAYYRGFGGISLSMEKQTEGNEIGELNEKDIKGSENRKRYIFQCQKCGACCEEKDTVIVSMADLERWNKDMTFPSLFPYVSLEVKDENYTQILLKRPKGDEGKVEKGCPLYDSENKICNIYFSMPLYCKSFPLGYDGEHFFLKNKSCPGLGKGKASEKELKEAREDAKADFEARVSTALLLPVIHGLAMRFIMEQSKKRIDSLTDEQKEKLEEILGKEEHPSDDGDP